MRKWLTTAIELPMHSDTQAMNAPPIWKIGMCSNCRSSAVRQFQASGKWIFSICLGIQILNSAGITKGRRVTCYEHVRSEVEQCGGTYVTEQAVRDGNIVTAQTWESHPDFYREIFRCLREAQ